MLWLGIYAISLLLAILFGRIYCGYICPMNTLMIPIEKLSKKLKIEKKDAPKWLMSCRVNWIALVASIVLMVIFKKFWYVNIPILLFWVIASLVITLFFRPSVFHNLICPFGPLQKIFGGLARFSKQVDTQACVGCRMCEKVCPSEAITIIDQKAIIDKALCHQCSNCKQVCEKEAISYSK